jgi:hypothetical protein
MGMTTYTAKLGEENIAFLTDTAGTIACAGLLDHVASAADQPDPGTMVFDNAVAGVLRDLPEDDDGHFDGTHIWIGGSEYEVTRA